MIGRLSGILLEKNPPQLLIDCNGVGYEVGVPMSTFYNLPGLGEKVVLLTHLVVREDAQLLFGFGNAGEREVFRQLIRIAGVGARTALSILSGMSVAELAQRHHAAGIGPPDEDSGHRQEDRRAPAAGIEGQARRGPGPCRRRASHTDASADVLNALLALGYSDKEAALAMKQVPAGAGVSEGIKLALKALSKG